MPTNNDYANRPPSHRYVLIVVLTALALALAPRPGRSQVQSNQQTQQSQQTPQNAALLRQQQQQAAQAAALLRQQQQQQAAQAAALQRQQQQQAAQAAALQRQQQMNNANRTPAQNTANQSNQARSNLANPVAVPNGNGTSSAAQRSVQQKNLTTPANTRSSNSPIQLATLNANRGSTPSGRPVPSRAFPGYPGPAGSTEAQTRNGSTVRKAADGSILDVRSPHNGMFIHHGLDGSQRILVDRPDHSRIMASSRGVQYVQHPYVFQGRTYDHRTLLVHGQVSHRLYRPYNYGGTTLDVYATTRYYAPNMYQWVASRSNTPQNYTWPYTNNPPPWFGHYKSYFTPDSSYATPVAWLADFLLAASLMAAYNTEPSGSQPAPADAPAAVTPEVKQMLAEEVGRQVRQESAEAQQNAQNREPQPGAGGVVQELADKQTHVFVVDSDLDLVDPTGRRCTVSEGDVVQIVSEPKSESATVDAVVMASKGGVECERSARVEIALNEVQEMQNHMRETIDQGMADTNAGKQAAKVTPAFAASAPQPDTNAAVEIQQQQQIAAAVEG